MRGGLVRCVPDRVDCLREEVRPGQREAEEGPALVQHNPAFSDRVLEPGEILIRRSLDLEQEWAIDLLGGKAEVEGAAHGGGQFPETARKIGIISKFAKAKPSHLTRKFTEGWV